MNAGSIFDSVMVAAILAGAGGHGLRVSSMMGPQLFDRVVDRGGMQRRLDPGDLACGTREGAGRCRALLPLVSMRDRGVAVRLHTQPPAAAMPRSSGNNTSFGSRVR